MCYFGVAVLFACPLCLFCLSLMSFACPLCPYLCLLMSLCLSYVSYVPWTRYGTEDFLGRQIAARAVFLKHFAWNTTSLDPDGWLVRIKNTVNQQKEVTDANINIFVILFWCRSITKKSSTFFIGEVFFYLTVPLMGDPYK